MRVSIAQSIEHFLVNHDAAWRCCFRRSVRAYSRPVKNDFRFYHSLRVRFADTDMQSIVFNGNYLTYYDVAWTEYFRAMGLLWKDMVASGVDTVLARTTIEYKAPARFDEMLDIYVRVARIGNTSLGFEFEIYRE